MLGVCPGVWIYKLRAENGYVVKRFASFIHKIEMQPFLAPEWSGHFQF